MNRDKKILVTGATGKQGGAVARHLVKHGYAVNALVRNPSGENTQELQKLNIGLVQGDLESAAELERAVTPDTYGIFSVQNYWEKGIGLEGEQRQLRNLLAAAKKNGVKHFVQSSIPAAATARKVLHIHSKKLQEDLVTASGLTYTFVSPVFFMDNIFMVKHGYWPLMNGAWGRKGFRFHLTDVDDIGGVTAEVFNQPVKYAGHNIPVISDVLTIAEMRELYTRITGKKTTSFALPLWMLRMFNAEMHRQALWNRNGSWKDLSRTDTLKVYKNLSSYEAFLVRNRNNI